LAFIAVKDFAVARQWSHPGAKKHKIFLSVLMSGKMFSNPDDFPLGPLSIKGFTVSGEFFTAAITWLVSWV
jgi:hypothetical protein